MNMKTTEMTLAEFEDMAFTHGPDLSEWPSDIQAGAARLVETTAEAQALLETVADLQSALTEARPDDPAPSVDLMSRILADAATVEAVMPAPSAFPVVAQPVLPSVFSRIWNVFSPAAACAASAALGLWLGYAGPVDLTDMAGGTFELAGLVAVEEFALLDDLDVSPMAGVVDLLEASE